MQFSIFGVPFGCTKDMFTWEKIRSTCFINWAILWRSSLVCTLPAIVFVSLFPFSLLHKENRDDVSFFELFLYLALYLVSRFMYYPVLYKVSFQTFDRTFIKAPNNLKFFGAYFWKPLLLSAILSFLLICCLICICVGVWFVLPKNQIASHALMLIVAMPSAFIFVLIVFDHLFIHGGTYGVVFNPANAVAKTLDTQKPNLWERIKLSFPYFFTSWGVGYVVGNCVCLAQLILFAAFLGSIVGIGSIEIDNSWLLGAMLVLWLSIPMVVNYRIAYDVLYKFPYRGVDRLYTTNVAAPKPWSLIFVSTYTLAFATKIALTFSISIITQLLKDDFVLIDGVVYFVAYCVSAIIVDISLIAFGAWGFVPVRKQPCALPGKQE